MATTYSFVLSGLPTNEFTNIKAQTIELNGATSGKATLQASATTTDYTVTLPPAVGAEKSVLKTTDASGSLGWVDGKLALQGPNGQDSVQIGNVSDGVASTSVCIGGGTSAANSAYSIAIGYSSWTGNTDTISIGRDVHPNVGSNNTMVGSYCSMYGADSNACRFGYFSAGRGFGSIGIGANSYPDGNRAIAIGKDAKAQNIYAVSLGANAQTTKDYQIMLGTANEVVTIPNALELNGSTSGVLTHTAAATTTSHTLTWPATQGAAGAYLCNPAGDGKLSWFQMPQLWNSLDFTSGDYVTVSATWHRLTASIIPFDCTILVRYNINGTAYADTTAVFTNEIVYMPQSGTANSGPGSTSPNTPLTRSGTTDFVRVNAGEMPDNTTTIVSTGEATIQVMEYSLQPGGDALITTDWTPNKGDMAFLYREKTAGSASGSGYVHMEFLLLPRA